MKKYLFQLFILLSTIAIIDVSLGHLFKYWHGKITSGDIGKANYIANYANEDVLIFGSSRAELHYNPTIFTDSLGLSSYNCGAKGMGSVVAWARLSMILERHLPKIVILDVLPGVDIYESDKYVYLGALKTYYDKHGIHEIFDDIDKNEKYKMLCQTYRYNSIFNTYMKDLFHPFSQISKPDSLYGFRPQEGKIDPELIVLNKEYQPQKVDSVKLKYLNRFIETAKNTLFVVVISPFWTGMDSKELAPIKELCKKNNVPFFDFSNDKKYKFNNELFMDRAHLNTKGANEFTKDLIIKLRPILHQKQ